MFLALATNNDWIVSQPFLYFVLILGAMLTAGVGVTVFSFYVDDYWTDSDYRESLRKGKRA